MVIVTRPGDDIAITVNRDDVTIRNVIIYHPASSIGIRGWAPQNLELYNVEVVAYGNEWGAQPCPTRSPFFGRICNNILIYNAEGVRMTNVRVENGSNGIGLTNCPGAQLSNVSAFNMRGPFPSGSCFSISRSNNAILKHFHCYNDPNISWTEDSVIAQRSSNVIIRDGVVDGNNSPTGMGVMFEGSLANIEGGLLERVEVINCQGCFSGHPMKDLY